MRKAVLMILGAALLLLCSCQEERLVSAFSARDELRLQMGGVEKMCYDPLTCQLSFNAERREFRVHTDNMSDFFYVKLSEIPVEDEQEVKGTVVFTTDSDIITRKNITLRAIRLEGDRVWLWSSAAQLGVEIQILD